MLHSNHPHVCVGVCSPIHPHSSASHTVLITTHPLHPPFLYQLKHDTLQDLENSTMFGSVSILFVALPEWKVWIRAFVSSHNVLLNNISLQVMFGLVWNRNQRDLELKVNLALAPCVLMLPQAHVPGFNFNGPVSSSYSVFRSSLIILSKHSSYFP